MRGLGRLAGVAMLLATPAAAHDFWIDLPTYRLAAGGEVVLRFLIGDLGAAEPWAAEWRKIVSLRSYGPDGRVFDQQAGMRIGAAGGATVRIAGSGTHLIAFETNHAESDLPADAFRAYAQYEGLTAALAKRRAEGKEDERGRELYSRRAKALVQIGRTPTEQVTRPIGQTLEIVPDRNPYALAAAEPLPVRILYHGAPLAGASVAIETLDRVAPHAVPVVTNAAGRALLPLAKQGRWRVTVAWSQPIDHPRAEYETVFSSLTFGF